MMASENDDYAAYIPYLRDFKPMLAPAWLDHVALVAGVEPPVRQNGFVWCDLGCGQGVTAAILAATHPSGMFYGIDAMPVHIDHARRLAAAAAVANLELHAVDFAAAIDLDLPQFDYIVAHGVYTWIGPETQCAVRRFIDRRLKPGGLVHPSYKPMPGSNRSAPRRWAKISTGWCSTMQPARRSRPFQIPTPVSWCATTTSTNASAATCSPAATGNSGRASGPAAFIRAPSCWPARCRR